MADLNSMIAQGAQFQAPIDPFVQYGRMQQLQQGQQTNALNQMKMDEYQRGLQEQNALRQLNPNASDYETQLFKVNPTLGIAYRKEAATAAAQQATADEQRVKSAAARQGMLGQAYRDISSRPSDANIIAHMENVLASPLFKAEEKTSVQKLAQTLLAMPLDQRQTYLQMQGAKPSDLKPTTQTVNRAGATDVIQVPAFGGLPTTVGSYADVPLPANVQTQKIQIARESRPPAQPRPEPAPRTQQITLSDGSLGIVNMDTGAITPSTLAGAPVKGKPSATAEKTAIQRKQLGIDLDRAIIEFADIVKDGGLIDQSTGSGAGRLVDLAAGFGGKATQGAIAIGKLQPIADLALKMVPRFEGPQSNADTTSYKQAAAQVADPTLPREIRKEAAKTVLRLMKDRKGQFASPEMVTDGVAPAPAGGGSIRDQADAILRGGN